MFVKSNEGLVSSYRLMIKARLNSSFKKRVQIKRAAILPDCKMPVDQTPAISDEERKQKLQTDFEAIFSQYDIGKNGVVGHWWRVRSQSPFTIPVHNCERRSQFFTIL
jgi:hypothetical protein